MILVLVGLVGLGAGLALIRALRDDGGRAVVGRFATAWERGDYPAMHRLLSPGQRRRVSLSELTAAYQRAAATATTAALRPGRPVRRDGVWRLPVRTRTRLFGSLAGDVDLTVDSGDDEPGLRWSPDLAFPGLRPGERLARRAQAPRRAALLARNGRLLSGGEGDQTELGSALGMTGEVGPAKGARRRDLVRAGFPANAPVGLSGLQSGLDARLRGRPGGTLLAGRRVLARATPVRAPAVRTTLDPGLQRAAQGALSDRFGGVAAIDPRNGEVLALAGIAADGLQPPGSTFKIMTVTAALEAGQVRLSSRFPVQTGANVGGRFLANAHDEACGGDLTESFSKSCNSVFAPMGVKLGARKLVAVAERFGFNQPPEIRGVRSDRIPRPADMEGPADVGASAIGQGRVEATALGMARVAGVIANDGTRARLTLVMGEPPGPVRVTSPRVAGQVRGMMIETVNGAGGTGTAAAIQGLRVAGKTGTAELGGEQPNDAWFAAFAPGDQPRLAVGVLVVNGGFGGETAAPIAREVLAAGLDRDE